MVFAAGCFATDIVAATVAPGEHSSHYLPYVAEVLQYLGKPSLGSASIGSMADQLATPGISGIRHDDSLISQLSSAGDKHAVTEAQPEQSKSPQGPGASRPSPEHGR